MKHSQVKGKFYTAIKKTIYGNSYRESIVETFRSRLQPGYYNKTNEFEVKIDDKTINYFCKYFQIYLFHKLDVDNFKKICKSYSSFKVERDEKVNRYLVTVEDVTIEIDREIPNDKEENVIIEFRSGGDYIVYYRDEEGNKRKSYGQKLKAKDFNEKGFMVYDLIQAEMHYILHKEVG